MLLYSVYEINDFAILQSKLLDLQENNWSVEVTPISNSNGDIKKYFLFCKKLQPKKSIPEKNIVHNTDIKLTKFFNKDEN